MRVTTGRYEGTGLRGTPRAERLCRLCSRRGHTHVEDIRHFLIECPAYAAFKAKWAEVFRSNLAAPADLLNQPNQAAVAHAIYDMVQHRKAALNLMIGN